MEGNETRLALRYKDATRAVGTLEQIFLEPYSTVVRDATIQRFEYSFEAVWKFLQAYLKEKEGVVRSSPKACFREMEGLGMASKDETAQWLVMTDRRNETAHTYREEVANLIYKEAKNYVQLMRKALEFFQNRVA